MLRDRGAGVKTVGTVPMIGWTTKRERACGYSVTKYGAQKEVNPTTATAAREFGWTAARSTTTIPTTPVSRSARSSRKTDQYLVRRFGDARHGGVAIYSLDNEPELWQWVHIDVHPMYPGYDDLTNLGITYATAIKQMDPHRACERAGNVHLDGLLLLTAGLAQRRNTGPDYVYYGNPVDRRAHGDVPFLEWYLKQFAAAERKTGRRLLDFLDIHGYIAPDDVQFKPAGDTANQVLRLESVLGLLGQHLFRHRRERHAVSCRACATGWSRNYPHTMTAITEYNLGALDHINGALAQADLLGVFGREGLDMAAIWAPPGAGTPGFYAYIDITATTTMRGTASET